MQVRKAWFISLCTAMVASSALFQPAGAQLLLNGFTFSRQTGISSNSSARSVVLGSSRVLGEGCRAQIQDWYRQQGISNWADQGCITEPENVIALPIVPGQPEQFEIIDKSLKFGVADKTVSTTSEATTLQKSVAGFTGFGYSFFVQPQN